MAKKTWRQQLMPGRRLWLKVLLLLLAELRWVMVMLETGMRSANLRWDIVCGSGEGEKDAKGGWCDAKATVLRCDSGEGEGMGMCMGMGMGMGRRRKIQGGNN